MMNEEEMGKRAELRFLLQEAAKIARELDLSPADFLLAAASGWNYELGDERLTRADLHQVLERYEWDTQDDEDCMDR